MKRLRRTLQPRSVVATVLAMVWLPFAGTRCLENPAGPSGAAGSVNCIFGHHEAHGSSAGHHHGEAHGVGGDPSTAEPAQDHAHASGDAGRHHDHRQDDTCCTQTGKRSVIPSASAGSEPPVAVAAMWLWRAARPPLAHHPERRVFAPVAHSPPIYLRNATLLI
jgi:hypothetical protein